MDRAEALQPIDSATWAKGQRWRNETRVAITRNRRQHEVQRVDEDATVKRARESDDPDEIWIRHPRAIS